MVAPWLWPVPLAAFRRSMVAFAGQPIAVPDGGGGPGGLEELAAFLRQEMTALRRLHGFQK